MSSLILIITIIGFYFMLGSEDAYSRFNVSFRNQIKFLIGMFSIFAIKNVIHIVVSLQVGAALPMFALVFLFIDLYIVKTYIDKL